MSECADVRYAVIIESVGSATPGLVGSVAKGLGLAVDETVKAVYRAPFILASKLDAIVAEQVRHFLTNLGFSTLVTEDRKAVVRPALLYDVTLQLSDTTEIQSIAERVSSFCGITAAQALDLIFAPPGLLLGGVSDATVRALQARLDGLNVSLLKSRPADARFDLFASGLSAQMTARLCRELAVDANETNGQVFAPDLTYAEANRIWRMFGRSGNVLLVDRQFQQFDIVLEAVHPDGNRSAQIDIFSSLFGIPADIVPMLMEAGEVVLGTGRRYGAFEAEIQALAQVGIRARADLATFAQSALEIAMVPGRERTAVLSTFGFEDDGCAQSIFTASMPVAKARSMKKAIELAGGAAHVVEH